MKGRWRLGSGFILAAYVAMLGLQAFHTHAAAADAQTECRICNIAHQTPALPNPPAPAFLPFRTGPAALLVTPLAAPRLTFQAHGLAPPTL